MPDRTMMIDGIRVPRFLYGTAWKEDETARLTALALGQGFRGIDTANQPKHYHEAGVGRGIEDAVKSGLVARDDLFLQTKFTHRRGQDHRLPYERRDVRAAVNLLLGRGFKPGTIGVHGTSYGAAVALLAAAAIPEIGAVVADSAFADMREVMDREIKKRTGLPTWLVRRLRPGLAVVANLLYGLDFDVIPPERAVPSIAPRSILFIHGREDRTIPVGHAYRLKAASENPTDELWLLPGGHTEGVRLLGNGGWVQSASVPDSTGTTSM